MWQSMSEGQELMQAPLQAMIATMKSYGKEKPSVIYTDSAPQQSSFLTRMMELPRVQDLQQSEQYPTNRYRILEHTADINLRVSATSSLVAALNPPLVSLQTKDEGNGRVVLGIGFVDKEDSSTVKSYALSFKGKPPSSITSLIARSDIRKCGSAITDTIFRLGGKANQSCLTDLGSIAKLRGLAKTTLVDLSSLGGNLLGKKLPDQRQTPVLEWVALSAILSLELALEIVKMPNLATRLTLEEATDGLLVHVVPSKGLRGKPLAIGTIQRTEGHWQPPLDFRPRSMAVKVLVMIQEVNASHLYIPLLKNPSGNKATLGCLFNAANGSNFEVNLPLSMLVRAREAGNQKFTTIPHLDEVEQSAQHAEGEEQQEDFDEEEDLSKEEIELIRASKAIESQECPYLDPPPKKINDLSSRVLADPFHIMDRIKVPTKHAAKRGFFVALREALFCWDHQKMKEVRTVLLAKGWTDEAIEAKVYFQSNYFTSRVPRSILPPSLLYPRVRGVYVLYGTQEDEGTPLFNEHCWLKAKQVLREICQGLVSDPPGIALYSQRQRAGQLLTDPDGLTLYDCCRGTNATESFHKSLHQTFQGWNVGVRMTQCLLSERRHRHNCGVSERKRAGYPQLGMSDTWLVDIWDTLIMKSQGRSLFPGWVHASAFKPTDEQFGVVPLQSPALAEAMSKICIGEVQLTEDEQYLAKAQKAPLPFLPITSRAEQQLFASMVQNSKDINFDHMAIAWVKHVKPSKNIWPKLPIYLSSYNTVLLRNHKVKAAVKTAKKGEEILKQLNAVSSSIHASVPMTLSPPAAMPSPALHPIPTQDRSAGGLRLDAGPLLLEKGSETNPHTKRFRGKDRMPRKKRECKVCGSTGCKGTGGRHLCPQNKLRT